jgi:hypothetical protein
VSEPATKDDLEQSTTLLRGEMSAMGEELRGEMRGMKEELRGEMRDMKEELRGEMRGMKEELRGEMRDMKGELRGEMRAMGEDLRGDIGKLRGEMGAMEARLNHQIGEALSHVAHVMLEHVSSLVAPFDDKYKDLLPAHAKLRADFDTHAADLRLHKRQPAAPAKRARRPRAR